MTIRQHGEEIYKMTIIDEIQAKTNRPASKRLLERVKGLYLESNKYERKIELEVTTVTVSFWLSDRMITRYEFMNALE